MPEMRFRVRWPDDSIMNCYSPSLVIKKFFNVGQAYPLDEFVRRSREALTIASERVKEKFGFYCTGATGQLAQIEETAARFETTADAKVTIEGFEE
jgi:uncharacterized repeat protein (TIGR04042 family)